jgi:flagellar assembly protein FliH
MPVSWSWPDAAARRKSLSEIIKTRKMPTRVSVSHERIVRNPFPMMEHVHMTAEPRRGSMQDVISFQPESQDHLVSFPYDQQQYSLQLEEEFKKGFEQGVQRASAEIEETYALRLEDECRQRVETQCVQLNNLIDAMNREWSTMRTMMSESVVRMSVVVAEHILKKEINKDKSVVINQVKEALRHVAGVEHIKLRIHPEDEVLIRGARTQFMAQSDSIRDIVIEPDVNIQQGGCILESDSGNVDATIETQLKKIQDLLRDDRAATR